MCRRVCGCVHVQVQLFNKHISLSVYISCTQHFNYFVCSFIHDSMVNVFLKIGNKYLWYSNCCVHTFLWLALVLNPSEMCTYSLCCKIEVVKVLCIPARSHENKNPRNNTLHEDCEMPVLLNIYGSIFFIVWGDGCILSKFIRSRSTNLKLLSWN